MEPQTPEQALKQAVEMAKSEPVEDEPTYVMPDASKGPVTHWDSRNQTFWLGFKPGLMDWEDIKLYLDSTRFSIYNLWKQIMKQRQSEAALAAQVAENSRGMLGKMFRGGR